MFTLSPRIVLIKWRCMRYGSLNYSGPYSTRKNEVTHPVQLETLFVWPSCMATKQLLMIRNFSLCSRACYLTSPLREYLYCQTGEYPLYKNSECHATLTRDCISADHHFSNSMHQVQIDAILTFFASIITNSDRTDYARVSKMV